MIELESVNEINLSIVQVNYNEFDNNIQENPECFKFKMINKSDVWKILITIKTKSGIDNINVKVMKDAFATIGDALTDIINELIVTGTVPDKLKISTVILIPKVSKTCKCEEYRPVYEKILETVVKQQLLRFHSVI
jgi:hypothetical protein